MEPDHKSVPFRVKAAGPADGMEDGQFEGYASIFGNVDSYGDIVQPGAFAKSLEEWREKGDPIPLLWGHDFHDPFSNIGSIDHAEEDEKGLRVRGTFDLENPKAVQVYRLAKGRRTTGMSFAYDVRESETKDDGTHLLDLHIYEASIVPIGANPLAGVESVKAAVDGIAEQVKAGRALSAKTEGELRAAIDSLGDVSRAIQNVLSVIDGEAGDGQGEKASGTPEVKSDASDEEPEGAKSSASDEEPKVSPSARDLAASKFNIYATAYAVEEGV